MRRGTPLAVLLSCHALVLALELGFYRSGRAQLLAPAPEPPLAARLALSTWFIPLFAGGGALIAGYALMATRGARRLRSCAVGLTVSALPVAVAVLAAYASLM